MDYKLAKQLKDAGFPQDIKLGSWVYTGIFGHPRKGIPYQYAPTLIINDIEDWKKLPEVIKIPTLSELIEECGDGFTSLIRDSKDRWLIIGLSRVKDFKTTEEAVAKLYLKLNKK